MKSKLWMVLQGWGSWCGRGRGNNRDGRGSGSKCAVYEAEMSDTSKPIIDATDSEVDIVKLLQMYGMVSTEGSELKHRRPKKDTTDEISMVPIQTLSGIHTTDLAHKSPLALQGSPLEYSVDDIEWSHVKIFCQLSHILFPILSQ